jgi:hypothetical protein
LTTWDARAGRKYLWLVVVGSRQALATGRSSLVVTKGCFDEASWCEPSERVVCRFDSVGHNSAERIDPANTPWGPAQFEAFWIVSGASPNPSRASAILVGQVKRQCGGVAAMRRTARATGGCRAAGAAAGGACPATENVRGWATRARLFQLHGAEGQQPRSVACAAVNATASGVVARRECSSLKLALANTYATACGSTRRELCGPAKRLPRLSR